MDGRRNNGGSRPNSGRPPKADEVALIERLSPLDNVAFEKLAAGMKTGDFQFIKLFFEYRFGKPKEKVELSTDPDRPVLFKLDERFIEG